MMISYLPDRRANEKNNMFKESFFDFVYIDGDHSENGAKSDLKNCFPKVRSRGVITGHDYCCNEKESRNTLLHHGVEGTFSRTQ